MSPVVDISVSKQQQPEHYTASRISAVGTERTRDYLPSCNLEQPYAPACTLRDSGVTLETDIGQASAVYKCIPKGSEFT